MPGAESLNLLSAELVKRLSIEDARTEGTAATTLVGGIVKAGSKLEEFLRELVAVTANIERCAPEDLLSKVGGKKPSLRKSMLGPLAYGVRDYFADRTVGSVPPIARTIIVDLRAPSSRILGFIAARNDIAKEGGDPSKGRRPSRELLEVIRAFRTSADFR